ncbi:MAG: hypothetical protein E6579_02595 [Clostridium sp.]|nr:hypothetical protein [Clostridium sp.]
MAMKVAGTRVSSFTDKKTGEVITFARLFVIRPADENEKGVKGEVAEAIKVKPELAAQAPVGAEIQPYYDKYGNIHAFDIVSPAK